MIRVLILVFFLILFQLEDANNKINQENEEAKKDKNEMNSQIQNLNKGKSYLVHCINVYIS